MLDTHLGPGFRLFEVKICHSPLDIERRLNIAHPRLPFRNVLFANAQPCVDLLGLLRLKHGAIVADQHCGGSVKTDSSVEYNQVGGQDLSRMRWCFSALQADRKHFDEKLWRI